MAAEIESIAPDKDGWILVVVSAPWKKRYRVTRNGRVSGVRGGTVRRCYESIPKMVEEMMYRTAGNWYRQRKADLARSVSFSPGDNA